VDHIDAAALEAQVLAAVRRCDPDVELIWIDPELADTATFCERYGHTLEESCNCIVVRSKTGRPSSREAGGRSTVRYAACVVQAHRRLDLNRHSRRLVDARKASFASADDTVARTGMVPGGVTPFGLPDDVPVFVDAPIVELDRVIVGGGSRRLKLRVRPEALAGLERVTVAAIGRDAPPRP
jgi:prolyl-tRNA editing enzyme YbaK/EbsC (Cys-tRNA(Pro) deacylase)